MSSHSCGCIMTGFGAAEKHYFLVCKTAIRLLLRVGTISKEESCESPYDERRRSIFGFSIVSFLVADALPCA